VAASEIEDRVRDAVGSVRELSDDGHDTSDALRETVERVTVSAHEITIELSGQADVDEPVDPIRVPRTPPRHIRHYQLIRNDQDKAALAEA
jgi:hypothetical protein